MPLGGAEIDRHAGTAQATVEQYLRVQPTEGMADQDGRLGQIPV